MGCLTSKADDQLKPSIDAQLRNFTYKNTKEPTYCFTRAKVIKVYDGDTFWVAAKYHEEVLRFKCRLYGVDCPEIRTNDLNEKARAIEARDYVRETILDKIVDIKVLNHTRVNGKYIKSKYGRLLVKVNINGKDLANELLKRNMAIPYNK